jgi:uncharacterized protein with beta-barrel porin domain
MRMRSRSIAALRCLALLAACAAPVGLSVAARADCVPDPAVTGNSVVCSGTDADGFVAGAGVDSLSVSVQSGASVDNGGAGTPSIGVNATSTVSVASGGSVTASGAGSAGISAAGADNRVTNSGVVDVAGDGARGVVVGSGTGISSSQRSFLNDMGATLDVNGTGAVGLDVVGDGASVQIFGTLAVEGAGGVGIRALTHDNSMRNDGAITVMDGGTGVLLGPVTPTLPSEPPKQSLFVNSTPGTIDVQGAGAVGIGLAGDGSNAINFGSIQATGAGSTGVAFSASGATLDNLGSIVAEGPAVDLTGSTGVNDVANEASGPGNVTPLIRSSSGTAILGGANVDRVVNRGLIEGDVSLGGGDDLYTGFGSVTGNVLLGAGDDKVEVLPGLSVTGSIDGGAGTDAFNLAPSIGTYDLNSPTGFETFEVEGGGAWSVSGSASFSGGTTVVGILRPQGVLTLGGDYTQAAGSTFAVLLDPGGTSDRLDVTGAVTIENGATLSLAQSAPLSPGDSFTILTATDGVSGEFSSVTKPNISGFLRTTPLYDGSSVQVVVTRASYTSAARTPNQRAVASALDRALAAGPSGDMATVLLQVDKLSPAEFGVVADALSPEVYDAQTAAALGVGRDFARLLEQRPLVCHVVVYEGPPRVEEEPPCRAGGITAWGALVGSLANRDGGPQHASYDYGSGGAALGVDARPSEHWLLSAELGGSRSALSFDEHRGSGDLNTVEVGAAATWMLGGTHLRVVGSWGHGWHQTRRQVNALFRKALGRHESDRLGAIAEVAHAFQVGLLAIEPIATADYAYLEEGRVSESGAGALSLVVDGRHSSVFSTTAGLRVSTEWFKYAYMGSSLEWADGVWRPEVDVRWRERWTGSDRDVSARFAGATGTGPFTVAARDARRGVELAARVSFQPVRTRTTVQLAYEAFVGDGTLVHQATARVNIPLP